MTASARRRLDPLWRRAVIGEATSGGTLVAGSSAVTCLLITALLSDFSYLDPGGGNVLNTGLSVCFLLGPLMAGLTALRAGQLKHQGALALATSTPRGRLGVLTVVGVAHGVWAMVAYLCFAVLAALLIGVRGPWTPGMALLPAEAVALLAICITSGLAVGSRYPSVLTGPALVIIGLLALNYLDSTSTPIGALSPVFPGTVYRYGLQPNAVLLAGLVAVMGGASAAIIGIALHSSRGQRVTFLLTATLLVTTGGLVVSRTSLDAVEVRSGESGVCRSRGGVDLCVWPGPGAQLDRTLDALVAVRRVLTLLLPVARRFHEHGLQATSGSVAISVPPPGETSVGHYAIEAMLPQACDAKSQRVRQELIGLINETLVPGSTGRNFRGAYGRGAAQAKKLPGQQQRWAERRVAAFKACD